MNMHIAVAGNIGAGKTTLTKMIAKRYGWEPRFEPVDFNPYLSDYYSDMHRWAFNIQIYFLAKRFQEVLNVLQSDHPVILDRTIFEDAYIFALNLHEMGMIEKRDYETYRSLFDTMISTVPLPNLMIYIRSSIPTLMDHIQRRGRTYEQSMRLDFLSGLQNKYEDWISQYKGNLLIIDGDNEAFEQSPESFQHICDRIDSALDLGTLF